MNYICVGKDGDDSLIVKILDDEILWSDDDLADYEDDIQEEDKWTLYSMLLYNFLYRKYRHLKSVEELKKCLNSEITNTDKS